MLRNSSDGDATGDGDDGRGDSPKICVALYEACCGAREKLWSGVEERTTTSVSAGMVVVNPAKALPNYPNMSKHVDLNNHVCKCFSCRMLWREEESLKESPPFGLGEVIQLPLWELFVGRRGNRDILNDINISLSMKLQGMIFLCHIAYSFAYYDLTPADDNSVLWKCASIIQAAEERPYFLEIV